MFKKILVLMCAMSSAHAFDYKINIESRIDLKHQKSQENGADTSKANAFEGSMVRLNFAGNVNEALSYRVRFRVNAETTSGTKDKMSASLDHAYIDHKNAYFTTRVGRTYFNESFARESMNSSTDLFLRTEAYNSYNKHIGTYKTGLAAIFKADHDQKFILTVSNSSPKDIDTTGVKSNTEMAYGAFYTASFFNKLFQPTLSYNLAPQDSDIEGGVSSATYSLYAVGFKSQITEAFAFEADWKEMEKEKSKSTATDADGKTKSLMAILNYDIGEMTPFITYIHDKFDADLENEAYKKNSYAAGVKWKPFNDLNFRYHLYYSSETTKFVKSSDEEKNQIYAFGFKVDI